MTSSIIGALNPEFGGEEAFARLSAALKQAGLGLILDFVPNHMAVGSDNAWWMDVLEWGQKSPRAASFDISWELLPYRHGGGVLLPVLGKPYGEALTGGEIALKYDAADRQLLGVVFRPPLSDQSAALQRHPQDRGGGGACGDEPAGRALLALADEHARPGPPSYAAGAGAEAAACRHRRRGRRSSSAGLSAYRADHEAGVNALHRLLERQHYRLADWRLAVSGINYRRFFDINELAGLARRGRANVPRHARAGGAADRGGPTARAAARSHRRAARPGAIHPAAAAADPATSAAANAASRSMSWSRKSWPTAKRCRRFRASPAPPATNG